MNPPTAELIRDVGDYEIVVTERRSHWLGMYNRDGYQSSPDPVEDRNAAQVALSGSIKWDGCSDVSIDDEPLHFCGRSDMEKFGRLLAAIYDLASEFIPSYEGG